MKFGLRLCVLLMLIGLQYQAYPKKEAIVNKPVSIPCICFGTRARVQWTIFSPIKAVIATCDSQTCQIEEKYQKRFKVLEDSGRFLLTIDPVIYNDAGFYKCTCNNHPVTEVKLEVYEPLVIKAFEGENVTLPCYGDTRTDADDVQWTKNGKNILNYSLTNKTPKGRFTISDEGFQNGNLSLHISSVSLTDGGLYNCLLHHESRDGDPRAVLLLVEKSKDQPPKDATTPSTWNIILILVMVLLICGFACYWIKNKRCKNRTRIEGLFPRFPPASVEEQGGQVMAKQSSTVPT